MHVNFAFEVTQGQIDDGVAGDSSACPVALGLRRKYWGADCLPMVDHEWIRIQFFEDGSSMVYRTPVTLECFILAFDYGEPVSPQAFELRDGRILRADGSWAD